MTNFRMLSFSSAMLLLLCSAQSGLAGVTITASSVGSEIFCDFAGGYTSQYLLGPTNTATATLPSHWSTTQRMSSSDGILTSFDQKRTGTRSDYAIGYSYTEFVVDVDTTYSIIGNFANLSGYTAVLVQLYDLSAGQHSFLRWVENDADAPFSMTLNAASESSVDVMLGSASGTLMAGHQYRFDTRAESSANPIPDDGATASGEITLQFGEPDVEVVPEPASIAVWSCLGLGAVGMTCVRRRRGELRKTGFMPRLEMYH